MNISEKISTFCIELVEKENKLDEKTKIHFIYAVDHIIRNIVFYIIFVLILWGVATLNKEVAILSIINFIGFYFMRINYGGYHLSSAKVCFAITIIIPLISGVIASLVTIPSVLVIIINILLVGTIIKCGIVEHPNKKLPEKMKKRLTKRGHITLVLFLLIQCLCLNYPHVLTAIALTAIITIIDLNLGRIYNFKEVYDSH
ncbi:accessory gene regulator B family protein [Vallitalea okinawensis]|uniref:accessory gene regulator B family protein n=1 Tax=Vallitalea okinawensis TaxID=2078660 RepID=UPI000CFB93A0|nr:accessory gene regulator B family protein [Vallitalea okinawensis]